jgi:hypothetical protein
MGTDRRGIAAWACRTLLLLLILAYAFALGVFLLALFGLAGMERDPLAGVFLIPLGLPWNLLVDAAPEPAWPWLAALAPCVNLGLLAFACRWLRAPA